MEYNSKFIRLSHNNKLRMNVLMSDYERKIIPYQSYETDALEGWFEDMARNGLLLEKTTNVIAKFKKEIPSNTTFRIDYNQNNNQSKNIARRDLLKDLGWEFVAYHHGSIYKTKNPTLKELPPISDKKKRSDPIYQAKHVFWGGVVAFLLFIFNLIQSDSYTLSLVYPEVKWIYIVDSEIYAIIAILLIIIFAFLDCLLNLISSSQLHARANRGGFPNRSFHNEGRLQRRKIIKIFFAVILLSIFVNLYLGYSSDRLISLTDYKGNISFPLLEEINPTEWEELSTTSYLQNNFDSYVMKNSTFLAPSILRTRQSGDLRNTTDDYNESKLRYSVNYFELYSHDLAEKISAEKVKNYSYQKLPINSDVTALFTSSSNEQHLLLCYENIVIEVWYNGETNLRNCINLYENYLMKSNIN